MSAVAPTALIVHLTEAAYELTKRVVLFDTPCMLHVLLPADLRCMILGQSAYDHTQWRRRAKISGATLARLAAPERGVTRYRGGTHD